MIATSISGAGAVRNERNYAAKMTTPFAVLGIRTSGASLTGIEYLPRGERTQAPADALAERACRQLERYLADPQFRFALPLAPAGHRVSPPRLGRAREHSGRRVAHLRRDGAQARDSAPRAIGGACGANPIALVIPCHRVVGSQGSLGGFMGAIDGDPIAIKRWLLTHEGYRFGR